MATMIHFAHTLTRSQVGGLVVLCVVLYPVAFGWVRMKWNFLSKLFNPED